MFLCSLKRFAMTPTAYLAFLRVFIFFFLSIIKSLASYILYLFYYSILFYFSEVFISCIFTQMLYSSFKSVSFFASKSSIILFLSLKNMYILRTNCDLNLCFVYVFGSLLFTKSYNFDICVFGLL